MKYGDFSSLVQLGIGLNVGTALLQLYGEIGLQPMLRLLGRIKMLVEEDAQVSVACRDKLNALEGEFDVFRIRFFNQFKDLTLITTFVAVGLVIVLILISFIAERAVSVEIGLLLAAFSILPTPAILFVLWHNASKTLAPLLTKGKELEAQALKASKG